jgi:hypothetical protein
LKLLIFLLLLGLLLAFVYWRLRPYIATARRVLGIVRDLRGMSAPGESRSSSSGGPTRRSTAEGERLVRCLACGTWTPAGRSVTLGGRVGPSYYCSHTCLERSAEGATRPRAANRQRR